MTNPQEDFNAWWDAHYTADDGGRTSICRRCGQSVGYVTKHAAERHGDLIEVMPVTNDDPRLATSY
jgi:hypothetical protein